LRADLRRDARLENADAQREEVHATAAAARDYVRALAGHIGAKLTIVSVGPERGQTIIL
jgi:adenylosuccinate synthase